MRTSVRGASRWRCCARRGSCVVRQWFLHELRRGARTPLELRFVAELAGKVRILTPTEGHWLESAEILARIGTRKGYDAGKLRNLAFDTLIALSARDSGATLITCNREDFAEIANHVVFKVIFW